MSPGQLLLGGLGGFGFSVDGLPNLNFSIPSIEIFPGGGGLSTGGSTITGDDGALAASVCQPEILSGGGGEGNSNFDLCQSLLGPCEMINLMSATAANELGDWDNLSKADNLRLGGEPVDPFTSSFNMDIGTCPSSNKFFRFSANFRIIEIPAGLFCSTLRTCISFSYGASFERCVTRIEADGSVTEFCARLCNCGNSGHGNLPAGGADFSGLYKAFANCLKAVATCMEPIIEEESGCPNCDINSDGLQALDTTF